MMASGLCSQGIGKLVNEVIIAFTAAAAYFCGKVYIFLWNRTKGLTTTPSGFGMLLPLFVVTFMPVTHWGWAVSLVSILIIFIAGLIYWLDDLLHLPPWIRILISFSSGVLLFLTASPETFFTPFELVVLSITCGIFSICLANVINFYDGSDLNLATMVFLTGIILLFFSDMPHSEFENIGAVMVGFSIGFGWINRIPLSLYLGDSGAFVLALLFTLFLINYVLDLSYIPAELMLVLALPIFDVFYVLMIRLYYKHDLLSRNYLHLYQRIRIRFGGFVHLMPQFINVGVILLLAGWIESTNILRFWALLFSSLAFTPIFYLACRILLVERNYFFGDGESNQS
jgi:UDP-N-acetylmuramyl pentapeptide phosphotransferase/UDP-N-acetylglucosamine-1-phosphate transferase